MFADGVEQPSRTGADRKDHSGGGMPDGCHAFIRSKTKRRIIPKTDNVKCSHSPAFLTSNLAGFSVLTRDRRIDMGLTLASQAFIKLRFTMQRIS